MKKKLLLLALSVIMVFSAVGCGDKEPAEGDGGTKYEVMQEAELGANMAEDTYSGFTASYDADKWVYNDMMQIWAIYDKDALESGGDSVANINVSTNPYKGKIDEKFLKDFKAEMDKQKDMGLNLEVLELREFAGENIVYYESKTVLTEAMIDMLIENGNITEADLDALGGRQALLDQDPVTQIGIHSLSGDNMLTITGTYTSDKEGLLTAMKHIMQTGKVA